MRCKKESFLPGLNAATASRSHGGEHTRGKRKTFRPIDPKQALHVVMRSSKASGQLSMLHPKNCNAIETHLRRIAKRWGIRIYRFANVGNHLHLLIKVPSRAASQRFLKEMAGLIPILITGARKGSPLEKNETHRGFWDHVAFTRIVHWGRDFKGVADYLIKNLFESVGVPMERLLARGYRIITISADGAVPDTS